MRPKHILFLAGFMLVAALSKAQFPYSLHIESLAISELPGVQSYAYAEHDGKWLIVGGRVDGLHQRQPFAAFLVDDNNEDLIVIDPVNEQFWTASLSSLPAAIHEQLRSTNMSFQQYGDHLYLVGGYGYSNIAGDHITYDGLVAIHVENMIDAIVQGQAITSHVRQINHANFKVAGGKMQVIDTTFYLLGGQIFTGRYNPMGPDHGPGFYQEYTNSIRPFTLYDDGVNITVNHLIPMTHSVDLHRRDYNAEPQIMPNGDQGITMFSGVFQDPSDLPYLDCVNVTDMGYTLNDTFSQYYNHYHCAVAPLYDANNQEMHNLFFGGIAQFYPKDGELIQDDEVPFVNTIGRVSRDANGSMAEYLMNEVMPGLMGAGTEFILANGIPTYSNGVVKLNELSGDTIHIGYIYGGIESSAPNIFFSNTGTQSSASSNIYKIHLVKDQTGAVQELNTGSVSGYQMQVYPNPGREQFNLSYYLTDQEDLTLTITDVHGRMLQKERLISNIVGRNSLEVILKHRYHGPAYFITLKGDTYQQTIKVMVR